MKRGNVCFLFFHFKSFPQSPLFYDPHSTTKKLHEMHLFPYEIKVILKGIPQGYPEQGTNFWGGSPDNNFGFGNSQISSNIENIQNTPVPNVQNQVYSISSMAEPSSSFSNSINPYARIKNC